MKRFFGLLILLCFLLFSPPVFATCTKTSGTGAATQWLGNCSITPTCTYVGDTATGAIFSGAGCVAPAVAPPATTPPPATVPPPVSTPPTPSTTPPPVVTPPPATNSGSSGLTIQNNETAAVFLAAVFNATAAVSYVHGNYWAVWPNLPVAGLSISYFNPTGIPITSTTAANGMDGILPTLPTVTPGSAQATIILPNGTPLGYYASTTPAGASGVWNVAKTVGTAATTVSVIYFIPPGSCFDLRAVLGSGQIVPPLIIPNR